MPTIRIETPDADHLAALGVGDWPVWETGVGEFSWHYDATETSYFVAGRVRVTPENGTAVEIAQGDLVTFPAGLSCTWKVIEPVRKHYRFD